MAKDLFSKQADLYAKYRPVYPKELYDYILSFVNNKDTVWDCATGNGQAAVVLADHLKKVVATDISAAQINKAIRKENIEYHICPAETTPFADNSFDLVTVAQAYHWIKWDAFKKEVSRVCKPGAVIAVWMYGGHRTDDSTINEISRDFYENITRPYWEPERKYVDENYATADFDYELLPTKEFRIILEWNRKDWLGYISTWSAVQKYGKINGHSPITIIDEKTKDLWPDDEVKKVMFPVYLKLGRVIK
jgi:ubiquinone/menaquinone biosynthesis C-methylase UbiE